MNRITTHVLDTSLGKPAEGISVSLAILEAQAYRVIARAVTDADGRVREFLPDLPLQTATYRLLFETAAHFRAASRESFFDRVALEFHVADPSQHYHVPLLLGPFGYTTYRGS
jgi:5-hydroxyisourate hydrolase